MAGILFVSPFFYPPPPLPSQPFRSSTLNPSFPLLLHSFPAPASLSKHHQFRSRFVCSVFSSSPIPSGQTTLDPEDNNLDADTKEVLLRGGDQVTSVLKEMIELLQDMELDEASEAVAVEIAAQGVIGKRVDEMESGFIMALDYMIQLTEKDNDNKRKSLLEIIKQTVLDHLTKKCPSHVQVIGLLCRTPLKESRHELLRRVAGGGGVFKGENDLKVQLPGANLNDIANQADDLLETMEARPTIPDRKLLARLVLIREEARQMMGGGILDERNDRGLSTLPEAEHAYLQGNIVKELGQYCVCKLADAPPFRSPDACDTSPNVPLITQVYIQYTIEFLTDTVSTRDSNTCPPPESLTQACPSFDPGLPLVYKKVNFLIKLVALKPGPKVQAIIHNVLQGKDEGADSTGYDMNDSGNQQQQTLGGIAGRGSVSGRKPRPVRPGMFLETVTKVIGGIYAGNTYGITAQHLEWVHEKTLQILQDMAFN